MSENPPESCGEKFFYVYWIVSGRSSYIGATVDPVKRLRQHCSIIKGGAKRTRGKLWTYKCVISGFRTWNEALMAEWSIKYHSRRCRGIESRKLALEGVLKMTRWTSNSPLSSEVPLIVEYDPTQYGSPPDELPTPAAPSNHFKRSNKSKWKKKLHGVVY